ncbi:MAG: hypothetical protein ABIF09_12085 [Gemmatimonadota bacterium]
MSEFEYLSVISSMVLALAISEILSGWGALIRFRRHVTVYWVHTMATLLTLIMMIQWWWSNWEYRSIPVNLFEFFVTLSPAFTMTLLAQVLTPSLSDGKAFDGREYYYGNRKWMYFLAALTIVAFGISDFVIVNSPVLCIDNAIRGAAVALLGSLALSSRERYHEIVLSLVGFLLLLFMGLVTLRL